jgi:hypothetical protein
MRDVIRDGSAGTNQKIASFQKLSCLSGVDVAEMLVPVDDRLAGFVKDVEDMPRLQDQGRQGVGQAVYDRVYR